MPNPQDLTQLRRQRDRAVASALASEYRIRSLDTSITQAERAGQTGVVAQLKSQREAATKTASDQRRDATNFREQAFAQLGQWLQQSPEQLVGACDGAHPFVLLPVRLETKFATTASGSSELRVRIFPDDISIAATPAPLNDAEVDAGQTYWRARVASRAISNDEALKRAYEGAWTALATRFGAYRASFITTSTKPDDENIAPNKLVFSPPIAPTDPSVPRADALPDRFVVLTYSSDPTTHALQQIHRVVGNAVPDDLVLAPDATQSDSWLKRDESNGRITFPDTLKWMVDFETAVAVGMAVRVPLASPFAVNGFARVVVLGIRGATPVEEGPATLEKLLAKHRYGDGCGIVRSGTPTNNTDSVKSGWQPPSSEAQQLFSIEDNPPDITPTEGAYGTTDGARLADLLGLSPEFARRLPNATATDIAEALTMNRAMVSGTLDNYVSDFLKDLVSPATADRLHAFFVENVSGRGHYPALRIGRQPYGIVLTSAWQNWKFPAVGPIIVRPQPNISATLYALLQQHRPRWQMLARRVANAGTPTTDPFQRLLNILGLLASSTEFISRRAVSDEYLLQRLRFGGAAEPAILSWFTALRNERAQNLSATNFPATSGATDPLIAHVVFTGNTDEWKLPIIDRDPTVPLSENATITPYNRTQNYLNWLSQATRADLIAERFVDAEANVVAHPNALLYVLLRHSLLAAIETSSIRTAQQFGTQFFDVVDRDPLIANIAAQQHVLRKDYLEVDASKIGLTTTKASIADWALDRARIIAGDKPEQIQHLAETHDAITALASLPTARLERLLAEHIDLCSYRLDAWITSLYAQRLAQKRRQESSRGIYLGAFGWVENLRPAGPERQKISPQVLPEVLRDGVGENLFEESANGGYVHAPSLAQASTAAVLRNGYLSHADSTQPLPFSVNLSSARMRRALSLIQGVRNGQSIAALLGYQLERGLHENHPGLELDVFIYALRDRFPLISGRLNDLPDGTAAETVEARNVVDALSLLEFTQDKPYPYSVVGLPAPGPEAQAIITEIDAIRDALDAVSDVLLAEGVHQAVQGNFARTKASLQALTSPEAPPEPEVLRTPRSGRTLTFRVAIAFDPSASNGWNAHLTPRAAANAPLNHWISQHLPPASKIQWRVIDREGTPSSQTCASLHLEPIDLVLMSGDRLGDGSSELERFILRRYRANHATPDEIQNVVLPATGAVVSAGAVVFDFATANAHAVPLARLYPMLVRLRRVLATARPIHAGDFRRGVDSPLAEPSDPTGSASGDAKLIAFKDLTTRLDAAASALTAASDVLKASLSAASTLSTALAQDPNSISNPGWPPVLEALRNALFALVPFGLPEALPADGRSTTVDVATRLVAQAQAVAKLVAERLASAAPLRATAFSGAIPDDEPARSNELARRNDVLRRNYLDTAKALFGPAFNLVPLYRFQPDQSAEIHQNTASPIVGDPSVVEGWIHSVSRVRSGLADLSWVSSVSRWIGHPLSDPTVLQLPFNASAPWIGGKFGADLPSAEWLSLVVYNASALAQPLQAGLLVDDWTETVPTDKETTGVSFNFNRPNATAPQAILVAVPPMAEGNWTWDDLVASVHEALDLSKLRAVEPDALLGRNPDDLAPAGDYFQTLPTVLSEFSTMRFATIDYAARVKAVFAQN